MAPIDESLKQETDDKQEELSERQKAKSFGIKKKDKVINDKPELQKFYISGKANHKGIKYNISYIIEAENETKAFKEANVRIAKDFTGKLRSLSFQRVRHYEDGDKEIKEVIPESPRSSSDTTSEDNNIINQEEILANAKENLIKIINTITESQGIQFYQVVITPGRKPRMRDFNKPERTLTLTGKSMDDAINEAENCTRELGVPFKRKWIAARRMSSLELANSNSFRDFVNNNIDDFNKKDVDIDKVVHDLLERFDFKTQYDKPSTRKEISASDDMKGANIEMDDEYIKSVDIKYKDDSIGSEKFTFKFDKVDTAIAVSANRIDDAIQIVFTSILKHVDEELSSDYDISDYVYITDIKTGKVSKLDYTKTRKEYNK